jgi:hypothetical protein
LRAPPTTRPNHRTAPGAALLPPRATHRGPGGGREGGGKGEGEGENKQLNSRDLKEKGFDRKAVQKRNWKKEKEWDCEGGDSP